MRARNTIVILGEAACRARAVEAMAAVLSIISDTRSSRMRRRGRHRKQSTSPGTVRTRQLGTLLGSREALNFKHQNTAPAVTVNRQLRLMSLAGGLSRLSIKLSFLPCQTRRLL